MTFKEWMEKKAAGEQPAQDKKPAAPSFAETGVGYIDPVARQIAGLDPVPGVRAPMSQEEIANFNFHRRQPGNMPNNAYRQGREKMFADAARNYAVNVLKTEDPESAELFAAGVGKRMAGFYSPEMTARLRQLGVDAPHKLERAEESGASARAEYEKYFTDANGRVVPDYHALEREKVFEEQRGAKSRAHANKVDRNAGQLMSAIPFDPVRNTVGSAMYGEDQQAIIDRIAREQGVDAARQYAIQLAIGNGVADTTAALALSSAAVGPTVAYKGAETATRLGKAVETVRRTGNIVANTAKTVAPALETGAQITDTGADLIRAYNQGETTLLSPFEQKLRDMTRIQQDLAAPGLWLGSGSVPLRMYRNVNKLKSLPVPPGVKPIVEKAVDYGVKPVLKTVSHAIAAAPKTTTAVQIAADAAGVGPGALIPGDSRELAEQQRNTIGQYGNTTLARNSDTARVAVDSQRFDQAAQAVADNSNGQLTKDQVKDGVVYDAVTQKLQADVAAGKLNPKDQAAMQQAAEAAFTAHVAKTAYVPKDLFQSDVWKNMKPEAKLQYLTAYSMARWSRNAVPDFDNNNPLVNGWKLIAGAKNTLSNGVGAAIDDMLDKDPEYKQTLQAAMQTADADTFLYLNEQAKPKTDANGKPVSDDTVGPKMKALVSTVLTDRMAKEPNFTAELAIKAAAKEGDGNTEIVDSFLMKLRDSGDVKAFFSGMTTDNFLKFTSLMTGQGSRDKFLKTLQPDERKAFMDTMEKSVKSVAFDKWKANPEQTHLFASLWFKSMGWNKLGEWSQDPWKFYGGLAAILLGGAGVLGGLLGGGGDDDEEDDSPEAAYRRRIKQGPQLELEV